MTHEVTPTKADRDAAFTTRVCANKQGVARQMVENSGLPRPTDPFWLEQIFAAHRIAHEAPLLAENERLRGALEFYANPSIYEPHPHGPAFDRRDVSYAARAALKQEPGT